MKPEQLVKDEPRRWENIRAGASNDARWRCVSQQVDIIDRAQVHRLQLRAAHEEQARKMVAKQKAKAKRGRT